MIMMIMMMMVMLNKKQNTCTSHCVPMNAVASFTFVHLL